MNTSLIRRSFLQASAAGFTGLLSALLSSASPSGVQDAHPDLVLDPEEGEVFLIGSRQGRVTIKAAKRNGGVEAVSLLTEDVPPGDAIPVHKHGAEEEWLYIESGQGRLTFGDHELRVLPGSMALVPRGVWHGLRNSGEETLRMVFGYAPAGFEDYFRAIGVPPGQPPRDMSAEDWESINRSFKVTYRE
jgi:mannose-6-phosphate isomerase-like protein (cupin superfamily)